MDAREYSRLLRAFERGAAREASKLGVDEETAQARRLVDEPRGRQIIAGFPSTREMRVGVRTHLERTLGLAGMDIRIGQVKISGLFRALDVRLRPLAFFAHRRESYRLYCGFEVPFTIATDEGKFSDNVLIDEDDDGWRCRSYRFTRESIRQRAIRPRRRIVVVTVADKDAADAVVLAARPNAIDVNVWRQAAWDNMQGDILLGALHNRTMKVTRTSKAMRRVLASEFAEVTTPVPAPARESPARPRRRK